MKKYRIISSEHLYEEDGELKLWYSVRIQMRILGFWWIDIRESIDDEDFDNAMSCAKEVLEYLKYKN